jgi:surface polysaccharide O-acyltransferase-like enzyme
MMLVHIDEALLMIIRHMIGIYLVHGWMHLFMVQVDYRLFGTGWCMVDALVYDDRLIFAEDFCLISVGAKNVS